MIRGWIIFSSLVFSVMFKLFVDDGIRIDFFPFSDAAITKQLWIYYLMEHIIAIQIAACIIIKDSTPRYLLWIFIAILILDFMHYLLFFRDEGPGWNLIKACIFGFPLLYMELKGIWDRLRS